MNRPVMIATIVAFFVASTAADAASCKYKVNEIDLFTKQKLVTTEWDSMTSMFSTAVKMAVGMKSSISIGATSEGEQRFVAIRIKMTDFSYKSSNEDLRDAILIPEGSPLTITLDDQSTIVLQAKKTVRGATRRSQNEGEINSTIIAHYPVSAEVIEPLLKQKVSYLTVAAKGGRYDFVKENGLIEFDVNRKGRDLIAEAITCLDKA